MALELGVGCEAEMDGTSVRMDPGECAIGTEESGEPMHAVFMLAETGCTVESSITCFRSNGVDVRTRVRSELEVIGADVALEGVMFSECLVARWIDCASESIVAFMCFYVAPKSCCSQETLRTPLPIAPI